MLTRVLYCGATAGFQTGSLIRLGSPGRRDGGDEADELRKVS